MSRKRGMKMATLNLKSAVVCLVGYCSLRVLDSAREWFLLSIDSDVRRVQMGLLTDDRTVHGF